MSQVTIWRGLEREIRAEGNIRLFFTARRRHAALAPYAALADAIASATPRDEAHRDAILRAFLDEYVVGRAPVWGAALALALRPLLLGLTKRAASCGEDAEAEVLACFLDAASGVRTPRYVAFRLYTDARRRLLRAIRIARKEAAFLDHDVDVDTIESDETTSIEEHIDQVRFLRRALGTPRGATEHFDRYVARLRRLGRWAWPERWRLRAALGGLEKRAEELSILCHGVRHDRKTFFDAGA